LYLATPKTGVCSVAPHDTVFFHRLSCGGKASSRGDARGGGGSSRLWVPVSVCLLARPQYTWSTRAYRTMDGPPRDVAESSAAGRSGGARKRKADAVSEEHIPFDRSRLECGVCFNIMLPPIRQCAEGHNFCDKCSSRLMTGGAPSARKCPTCRIQLTNPVARARNLEHWAAEVDVEVTCDMEECGAQFRYSEYADHQKTCIGRTVACPKRGCTWRGEASALGAHLQDTEAGHKLCQTTISPKFSSRHQDYSLTCIFETRRKPGDKRRWRPPRQLVVIPPNSRLGTPGVRACARVPLSPPPRTCSPALSRAIQLLSYSFCVAHRSLLLQHSGSQLAKESPFWLPYKRCANQITTRRSSRSI
jgi:hypothetical protein